MRREELAEDDKYLLEIDLEDIETKYKERQEYWILDIQAARNARVLQDSEISASEN